LIVAIHIKTTIIADKPYQTSKCRELNREKDLTSSKEKKTILIIFMINSNKKENTMETIRGLSLMGVVKLRINKRK
jgi:hypothetical protein